MFELSEKNYMAADLFVGLVTNKINVDPVFQPETIIASSARLAGSLLMRSFDLKIDHLQPGTVVLSEEANNKGPLLINIMAMFLQVFEISVDEEKLEKCDIELDKIKLTTSESIGKLQNDAYLIMKEKSLNFEEAAQSAAMATASFIKDYASIIGAETGFKLAVYGVIDGSKTAPPPLNESISQSGGKPWYKFW